MNEFNKTINGKGWILLGSGLVAFCWPLLWVITGQYVDPISLWSLIGVASMFTLVGLYALKWFFVGRKTAFLIKRMQHFSTPRFIVLTRNNMVKMEVIISKTMLYRTTSKKTPMDHINKLFGFSSGWDHLKHSARFGWKPSSDGKRVEIWAYARINGMIVAKLIGAFHPRTKLKLTILDDLNGYLFDVSSNKYRNIVEIDTPKRRNPLIRYLLWPYFGGEPKAVRNIIFMMERL